MEAKKLITYSLQIQKKVLNFAVQCIQNLKKNTLLTIRRMHCVGKMSFLKVKNSGVKFINHSFLSS